MQLKYYNNDIMTLVQRLVSKLKKEAVFTAALFLALLTSMIVMPKISYIDFKVLASLFNLMAVIGAFEKLRLLDVAAVHILKRFSSFRKVSFALIMITCVAAMFITNDVALITFVPITIITARKAGFNPIATIIFQTLAANIGSSLTPMGNPQNLYLFTIYRIGSIDFFKTTFIFTLLGVIWLFFLNRRIPATELIFNLDQIQIKDKGRIINYFLVFIVIILSIFRIIDYRLATCITIAAAALMDREIFKNIDYFLLFTFIFFFISIGNLSNMAFITRNMNNLLGNKYSAYFTSLALSQFISNVPAAILLSGFTREWKSVLLGVDIGGMGTLIASLASVISYKLYTKEYQNNGFLLKFHTYNFIGLLLFATIMLILL